jgi:hypothetical protein
MGLRSDSGQAGVVVLVSLIVILAVAALAIDGAVLVAGKIGLGADADAAARSGAGALNQAVFSSTGRAELEPFQAEAAARAYAATTCPSCSVSVSASPGLVQVTLHRSEPTFFLEVLGIRSVQIDASASAAPVAR